MYKHEDIGDDVQFIEMRFNELTNEFEDICVSSYKTLVEEEYKKHAGDWRLDNCRLDN